MNVKDSSANQLTKLDGREYDATWSPDDRFIAFTTDAATPGIFNIHVSDVTADHSFPVVEAPYSIRYLSWSKVETIELEAKRIVESEQSKETSATPAPSQGSN